MFRTLRFRLPALFLAGVVASGLVAAAIAFQLLQQYTLDRARSDLRREAAGITDLYSLWATVANEPLPTKTVERTSADQVYFVPRAEGIQLFYAKGLVQLPRNTIDMSKVLQGRSIAFTFTPPGQKHSFLAIARPLDLHGTIVGALVVAKPKDQFTASVVPLLERLALALLGGLGVAGLLAIYLSRRLTKPVLELSRVADEVAQGHYDVPVPAVPGGSEVGHLADRFREMARRLAEAEQLERNFLMSVSHELRTPLTAIRGHVA